MKKILSVLLAALMLFSCALSLTSCNLLNRDTVEVPGFDLDAAAKKFNDRNYTVTYIDSKEEVETPAAVAHLTAYKKQYVSLYKTEYSEYLEIIKFEDKKSAKLYHENTKSEWELEKATIKSRLELLEHLLDEYREETEENKIKNTEKEISNLKEKLENLEKYQYGVRDNYAWRGTETAIKLSRT